MSKADRADRPHQVVWVDDDHAADRREYAAHNVRSAALVHAQYLSRHLPGAVLHWPATFHVKDLATGKRYTVNVKREMRPEFTGDEPVEIL